MVVSVASYVIVGWVEGGRLEVFPPIKCLYFHTTSSMTEFSAFSETDFYIQRCIILQITIDRVFMQLNTCMVYVYVNTTTRAVTNLVILAFQQLKSILWDTLFSGKFLIS